MITLQEIKKTMRDAVYLRRKLIRTGKSQLFYDRLHNDLAFIEAYSGEIKNKSRMAAFFINHFDKIKRISPPNWSNKLDKIYTECQLIIKSNTHVHTNIRYSSTSVRFDCSRSRHVLDFA